MFQAARHSVSCRFVVSSTLLAGLVLSLLLAAFPALHEQLHSDADGNHHECLATALHHGMGAGNDASAPPIRVSLGRELFFVVIPDHSRAVVSLFLGARIFEHAPPLTS